MPFPSSTTVPHVFRGEGADAIPALGRKHSAQMVADFVQVRNDSAGGGALPVRVYFDEASFNAGRGFIVVPAGEQWEGPASIVDIWLQGVGGAVEPVTVVMFPRRGY